MMPERVSTGQVFFSRCGRMGVGLGGLRCVKEITSLSYNIVTECFLDALASLKTMLDSDSVIYVFKITDY